MLNTANLGTPAKIALAFVIQGFQSAIWAEAGQALELAYGRRWPVDQANGKVAAVAGRGIQQPYSARGLR